MKPEQFIRWYGIEDAKYLIEQNINCNDFEFSLDDLKRLVESVEIIQFWHGIEWCKGLVEDYKEEPIHKESYGHRIIQAIADYESIYGGGDES
ncbi:hypothetical protein ABTE27_07580 [Acinetobacter baumannii]|uniref:hypothetical protein n=2 Tax=Acinetobacter calcoaceticus/baumannii complex TaxID=909768 RepID=UPI002959DA5B|nr:hypothetical protein [Acinetobacter baumannii]